MRLTDAGVVDPKSGVASGSWPSSLSAVMALSVVEGVTSPLFRSTLPHVTMSPAPIENLSLMAQARVGWIVKTLSETFCDSTEPGQLSVQLIDDP